MEKTLNNEKLNYEVLQVLYNLNGEDDGDLHWVTTNTIWSKLKSYELLDIENSLSYLHDCERIVCSNSNKISKEDSLKYAITNQGITFIEE